MRQQRRNLVEHMSLKLVTKEYTRTWYQRREIRLLIFELDYKVFYSTLNREQDEHAYTSLSSTDYIKDVQVSDRVCI